MAQTGYTPIQLYYSTTQSAAPSASNLATGELAINIFDGKLYYKDMLNVVRVLASAAAGTVPGANTQIIFNNGGAFGASANLTWNDSLVTLTTTALSISGGTANGVAYLNGSKVLTTGSALTFDGTNLGLGTTTTSPYRLNVLRSDGKATFMTDGATADFAVTCISGVSMVAAASTGVLAFGVSNTEQMRLTTTGLLVKTSSAINSWGYAIQSAYGLGVQYGANNNLEIFSPNSGTGIRLFARNNAGTLNRLELQGGQVIFPLTTGADGLYFDASAGNLGLGVTPSAWVGKAFEIGYAGSAVQTSASGYMRMMANTYQGSGGNFYYAASSTKSAMYEQNTGQHIWYTAPSGTAGNAISFTQAMTLDASGNLLVGTTGTGIQNANSMQYLVSNAQGYVTHVNGTGSGTAYWVFGYNGSGIGSITQNGTTGVLYNITSDYRLKENVAKITNGLDTISKLNPVTFDWTTDKTSDSGFIAHEFQSVLPRSVTGTKDAVDAEGKPVYQGMDNSGAVPYLVAAVQELMAQNEALIAKLKAAGVAGF